MRWHDECAWLWSRESERGTVEPLAINLADGTHTIPPDLSPIGQFRINQSSWRDPQRPSIQCGSLAVVIASGPLVQSSAYGNHPRAVALIQPLLSHGQSMPTADLPYVLMYCLAQARRQIVERRRFAQRRDGAQRTIQ